MRRFYVTKKHFLGHPIPLFGPLSALLSILTSLSPGTHAVCPSRREPERGGGENEGDNSQASRDRSSVFQAAQASHQKTGGQFGFIMKPNYGVNTRFHRIVNFFQTKKWACPHYSKDLFFFKEIYQAFQPMKTDLIWGHKNLFLRPETLKVSFSN